MHARDATGRQVSLLNDDAGQDRPSAQQARSTLQSGSLSRAYPSPTISSSSPNTPELLKRSDSYDSQMSSDAISPLTPSVDFNYPRSSMYSKGHEYSLDVPVTKRPVYVFDSRSASYEDESSAGSSDRPAKRYPCRYRDTHGCEKTFTTSGHASRHSKIHTAEKAVQCTYAGCPKKFTRADNMKQHLETHYKEKSRSSATHRPSTKPTLVEARRNSYTARRSNARESGHWDMEKQQPLPAAPLASPTATQSTWNMSGVGVSLPSRPMAASTPNSGLDALAMAVACQEGG